MYPRRRTFVKRTEKAIELIREARSLISIDDPVAVKLLNDCENVLSGGEDKELYLTTPSNKKYSERANLTKEIIQKEERTTKIKCEKCEKIWAIYKIEDKWIFKCDCETVLIFEGQLTKMTTETTYSEFLKQNESKRDNKG